MFEITLFLNHACMYVYTKVGFNAGSFELVLRYMCRHKYARPCDPCE